MNFNFTCIGSRINLDVPYQIWEAQTADPTGEIFLTRMFHNKPGSLFDNYFRCYLSYLSADFITKAFTIIGLFFFLIGVYFLLRRHHWWWLGLLLIAPLFPLFEFPGQIFVRGLIVYLSEISVLIFGIVCLIADVAKKKTR